MHHNRRGQRPETLASTAGPGLRSSSSARRPASRGFRGGWHPIRRAEAVETRGGAREDRRMTYPMMVRQSMIEKMLGPDAVSASQLARDSGISLTTLCRWRQQAMVEGMSDDKTRQKPSGKPPRRPQDWSPQERLEAVARAATLSEDELGAFLRRAGLREGHLKQWRQAMLEALDTPAERRRREHNRAQTRRIKELERELNRKDKALAETAALLALKEKPRRSGGARTTALDRGTPAGARAGRGGPGGRGAARQSVRHPRAVGPHGAAMARRTGGRRSAAGPPCGAPPTS